MENLPHYIESTSIVVEQEAEFSRWCAWLIVSRWSQRRPLSVQDCWQQCAETGAWTAEWRVRKLRSAAVWKQDTGTLRTEK